MGILDRFTTIVKANINDMLDKAEDPAKMTDQLLRDMTESLAEVKSSTAGVMAEETRTKRLVDENEEESKRYEDLAKKAIAAGNDDDARVFIEKKQQIDANHESLVQAADAAAENAHKMREMHDKLVNDIETLKGRQAAIKAKVAVAKTQNQVNQATGSDKAASAMDAFTRMEEKADAMLDKSNAMTELNSKPVDATAELERKYGGVTDASIEDELERMKKDMAAG